MRTLRRVAVTKSVALLTVWLAALAVHSSFGQGRGKVTVQVSVPGDQPVNSNFALRIRAIPISFDAAPHDWQLDNRNFNFTEKFYQYTFQGLPPGQYAFVVCDGLDYVPEIKTQTVQAGPNANPVTFFLKAPKEMQDVSLPVKRPDGTPVEKDRSVFLKDIVTGCNVASIKVAHIGTADFKNVPKREYAFNFEGDDQDPGAQP